VTLVRFGGDLEHSVFPSRQPIICHMRHCPAEPCIRRRLPWMQQGQHCLGKTCAGIKKYGSCVHPRFSLHAVIRGAARSGTIPRLYTFCSIPSPLSPPRDAQTI